MPLQYESKTSVGVQDFPMQQFLPRPANEALDKMAGLASKIAEKKKDEAINDERAQIVVNANQQYEKFKQNSLDNLSLDSTDKFKTTTDAWNKGFLSTVSKYNQNFTLEHLSSLQVGAGNEIATRQRELSKNILLENSVEYVNTMQKNILLDDQSGAIAYNDKGKALTDPKGNPIKKADVETQQLNGYLRGLTSQGISGSFIANTINSVKDARVPAQYIGAYADKMQSGDIDGAKKLEQSLVTNKNLTWEQKRTIEIELGRIHGIFKTGEEVSKASLKDNLEGTLEQVKNGNWDPSDARVTQAFSGAADAGIDIGHYKNQLVASNLYAKTAQALIEATPAQQQVIRDSFALKPDDDARAAEIKGLVSSSLDKLIAHQSELIKKDGAAAYEQTKLAKTFQAVGQTGAIDADGNKTQGLSQIPVDNIQARMLWQASKNIPLDKAKPLTNAEAAQKANDINTAPNLQTKLSLIGAELENAGKYKPQLLKQLKKVGVPEEVFAMVGLDQLPQSAPYLNELNTTFNNKNVIANDKTVFTSGDKNRYIAAAAKEVAPLLNTIPNTVDGIKYKEDVANTVALAAMGHHYQNANDHMDKSISMMAKVLYKNRFSVIDGKIRVPHDIAPENAKMAIRAMNNELENTKFKNKQEELNVLAGHWETNGDNSGLYWMDNANNARQDFSFKWNDISNPASKISQLMAKKSRPSRWYQATHPFEEVQ